MAKRRVAIERIKDDSKRHTTFTKRRKGLEKKMHDLCLLCDVEGVVITFSKSGNIFACGHPAVDLVVDQYLALQADVDNGSEECAIEISDEEGALTATGIEKMICEAMENGKGAWEATVKDLGISEIVELEAAVKKIKKKTAARGKEVAIKEEAHAREVVESGKRRTIRGKILEAEFGWGN